MSADLIDEIERHLMFPAITGEQVDEAIDIRRDLLTRALAELRSCHERMAESAEPVAPA